MRGGRADGCMMDIGSGQGLFASMCVGDWRWEGEKAGGRTVLVGGWK